MRICVLDLGGTSFQLMHARKVAPDDLVILGHLRLPTAIGQSTMQTGVLSQHAYSAGIRDIERLCQEVHALAPDRVVAVATSAIRAASNSHTFIAEVKERFGLSIQVLSGEEEAMQCYRGALSALGGWNDSLAVVDLGGGSCEIAVGNENRFQNSHSADIGVIPIKEAFRVQGKLSPTKAHSIASMVRLSLRSAPADVLAPTPDKLVLASGNARAVYKLAASLSNEDLAGQLSLAALREVRAMAIGRYPQDFIAHGLTPNRAEHVAIAIVVLETIMATLQCQSAEISQRGLREGVALSELAMSGPINSHTNQPVISPCSKHH